MNDLINWIEEEMAKRGWRPADLARKAEIDSGFLSRILSGQRQPGLDACIGIARALGVSIDTVVRHARPGELPPITSDQASEREILYKIRSLDQEDRLKVMEYIKWAEYQARLEGGGSPTVPGAASRAEDLR